MLDAYAIGVTLTLRGNIAEEIRGVAGQFEALNKIVRDTQATVSGLSSGMRGLQRIARETATAWRDAAVAMERAVRSVGRAQDGDLGERLAPRFRAPPYQPDFVTGAGPRGGGSAYRGRGAGGALVPYQGAGLPTPWVNPATGFDTEAGPMGGGSAPRQSTALSPYNVNPNFSIPGSRGALGAFTPGGSWAGGPGTESSARGLSTIDHEPFGEMWSGFSYQGGRGGFPPFGGYPPGEGPRHFPMHSAAIVGAEAGAASWGMFEVLKQGIEARLAVDQELYRLTQQQFSPEQTQQALALAQSLQQKIPGTFVGGNLEIMRDWAMVTQHPAEALKVAPEFAKLGNYFASIGHGDQVKELLDAFQTGELRGAFNNPKKPGEFDTDRLLQFIQNLGMAAQLTGGRIGPAQFLQYMRSGGVAARNLSDPGLFPDALASIISMGAANAGRGLQGLAMQFSAGRMSEAGAFMLEDMGLIDRSKMEPLVRKGKVVPVPSQMELHNMSAAERMKVDPLARFHVGLGQFRIPPQYMPSAEEATRDPFKFILEKLVPASDYYNKTFEGGLPTDPEALALQRQVTIMQLASRFPGANLGGDTIANALLIGRDRDAAQRLRALQADMRKRGIDPLDQAQLSPDVKVKAFQASLNALMVALGGVGVPTVLKGLADFTNGLNAVATWAQKNPDEAKRLIEAAAGFTALSAALSVFSTGAVGFVALKNMRDSMVAIGRADGAPAAARGLGELAGALPGLVALVAGAGAIKAGVDALGQEDVGAASLRRSWHRVGLLAVRSAHLVGCG